jgi:putative polyhydroxyalkanoate system protein
MADIEIVKSHSLTIAQAKALVQKSADELAAEYDLTSEWQDDALHFHRPGIDGRMLVTDSEVRLELTLGLLLKPFKGKFIDRLERNFDRLLAGQGPNGRESRSRKG